MNVRLVSITSEAEKFIVYVARVSNPKNQDNPNIARLVRYLIEHKHWSPFEHSSATFEIETSRAIAAQLLRHRSFSFQEFSLRYEAASGYELFELRKQAQINRQSSTEVFDPPSGRQEGLDWTMENWRDIPMSEVIEKHLEESFTIYEQLMRLGVAKESARFILPLATTTKLYMTGNIRSWITYLLLRTQEDTQKEHRLIAEAIKQTLATELPITWEALGWRP